MTFPLIDLFSTRPSIALGSIQIPDDQLKNYIKKLKKKLLSFMLQDIAYITFYFVQNENYLNKNKKIHSILTFAFSRPNHLRPSEEGRNVLKCWGERNN